MRSSTCIVTDLHVQIPPLLQTMDEGSRNLVQTCDAFVSTLDEIMELTEASHMFAVASNRVGDSYNGGAVAAGGGGSRRGTGTGRRRSRTTSVGNDRHSGSSIDGGFQSLFANDGDLALHIPEEAEVATSKSAATSPRHPNVGRTVSPRPPSVSPTHSPAMMPFDLPFKVKFSRVSEGSEDIATQDFVSASTEAIKIFGENCAPRSCLIWDRESLQRVTVFRFRQICSTPKLFRP